MASRCNYNVQRRCDTRLVALAMDECVVVVIASLEVGAQVGAC